MMGLQIDDFGGMTWDENAMAARYEKRIAELEAALKEVGTNFWESEKARHMLKDDLARMEDAKDQWQALANEKIASAWEAIRERGELKKENARLQCILDAHNGSRNRLTSEMNFFFDRAEAVRRGEAVPEIGTPEFRELYERYMSDPHHSDF